MPNLDIPTDDNDSVNSSLLSFSSNENGSASNRSIGSSMNLGFNNSSSPIGNDRSHQNHSTIPDLQSVCREPTLDAVLRKACSGFDLDTMTHIQMRVSPNVFGLHQMHIFLPNLMALNLDGSYLESLRDLGCDLKVKYLNVSRCGLRHFDGISGFDTVEHLVADDNAISNIMQLSGLQELHTLSLRGNKIKQINAITFLSSCIKLNNVDFTNNPIVNAPEYRQKIKLSIASLLILDGFGFDEHGGNVGNSTECSSSLSSDISKDSSLLSDRHFDWNLINRPKNDSNQIVNDRIDSTRRLSTAESSSCSVGEAIVGNIVNKVRRNRRQKANAHKTISSDSSSASLSLLLESNAKHTNPVTFPSNLPLSAVPLEFGILDTMPAQSNAEPDAHQLIEMCRRWRELSRKSREAHDSAVLFKI